MKRPLPRSEAEPGVIALVEESVHLLRLASPETLAIYYLGAGPWVVAVLFFWAHASWFAPTGAQLAWQALGMVALYAWLKTWQAEFCARLMAQRLGCAPAPLSLRRLGRLARAQFRMQAWGVFALSFSALVMLPFAWVWTFFQNVTVLGDDDHEPLADAAWKQAGLWPRQSHLALLIFGVLSLYGWVNLAMAFHLIPWLADHLLGLKSFMSVSGWAFLNTTFLAAVTALTWLAFDPLVKAFYVLRVFHGRAQRTGEDLRIELAAARAPRRAGLAALVLMVAVAEIAMPRPVRAGTAGESAPAVTPAELDASIDRVLAQRDFRWQLHPLPKEEDPEAGPVKAFFKQGVQLIHEIYDSIERLAKRIGEWLDGLLPKKTRETQKTAASAEGVSWLKVMLYGFIGLAVILIGYVVWLARRQGRRTVLAAVSAQASASARPDLSDENIQAAQLPADGWLSLAHEQMARGEWRLALRALYLCSLARLGAEGLLTLARFKTNLDYERELRRRALNRPALHAWFSGRRGEFESVWYGRVMPGEAQVRAWMADLEGGTLP